MTNLWHHCEGKSFITDINETVWRVIRSPENSAIRKLVDSTEEQKVLEGMIESTKPLIQNHLFKFTDTPFRYPHLKFGSRFGKKTEPSIWYGSLNIRTAMAEKAFYELAFLLGSEAKFDLVEKIITSFSMQIKSTKGIKLHIDPFLQYKTMISSPISYTESQLLGFEMRRNDIEVFTYISARDPSEGLNVGLINSNPIMDQWPNKNSFQTWQCISNKEYVELIEVSSIETNNFNFTLNDFVIDGILPFPAN